MPGPPPFEPSVEALKSQSAGITTALARYEAASSSPEKTAALRNISESSSLLAKAATPPPVRLQQLTLQPQSNAVVRIGVQMGLFDHLPLDGSATIDELATKCNAQSEFTLRIARALASLDMIDQTPQGTYAANQMSLLLRNEPTKALIAHMTDNVGITMLHLSAYFKTHGFKSPSDPQNTPGVAARGLTDVMFFDWMLKTPPLYDNFNKTMAFQNSVGAKEVAQTYPFSKLPPGKDGIKIVDVGGGLGHVLAEIISVHPSVSGHAVIEDLSSVVSGDLVVPSEQAKTQTFDFINETQPVKGASAYLLRHILHDWPDSACQTILRNHVDALRGSDSRLLISEMVIPDQGAPREKALRDINMMQLAAKERGEKQWRDLLGEAGFRIVEIHGRQNLGNSIIEAVLAG